jgi:Fe-S-cluster-containing dehydrogenase component
MTSKCPGQDSRNIRPEKICCPHCGYFLEIFSDEIKAKCPQCKKVVRKDRLPSCVDWCKAAQECVGDRDKD